MKYVDKRTHQMAFLPFVVPYRNMTSNCPFIICVRFPNPTLGNPNANVRVKAYRNIIVY